ncbi:MAG: glutaredoxin family protein [Methanomicrobiales archaeon]
MYDMCVEHVRGKNKGKVMLYALSTCGWCNKTKELLREMGIEFYHTYVDLLEGKVQDEAMDNVERFNPSGSFPTLVINDKKCIVGFQEQEIREVFR